MLYLISEQDCQAVFEDGNMGIINRGEMLRYLNKVKDAAKEKEDDWKVYICMDLIRAVEELNTYWASDTYHKRMTHAQEA